MDNSIYALVSVEFIFFCLMLVALTTIISKFVNYLTKKGKLPVSDLWNDVLLPVMPIIIGMILALLFKKFPYPQALSMTSGRFIFGTVSGLLSTVVYRLVWSTIKSKISSNLQTVDDKKDNLVQEPKE